VKQNETNIISVLDYISNGLINRQASHCEVLYLVIENRSQPIKFTLKNPFPRFLPNQRETLFYPAFARARVC